MILNKDIIIKRIEKTKRYPECYICKQIINEDSIKSYDFEYLENRRGKKIFS
jgi:uncharacterized CHY-type Zn-finger protein